MPPEPEPQDESHRDREGHRYRRNVAECGVSRAARAPGRVPKPQHCGSCMGPHIPPPNLGSREGGPRCPPPAPLDRKMFPSRLEVSCEGCFLVPQTQDTPALRSSEARGSGERLGSEPGSGFRVRLSTWWFQSSAGRGSAATSQALPACQLPLPASPPGIAFDFPFVLHFSISVF